MYKVLGFLFNVHASKWGDFRIDTFDFYIVDTQVNGVILELIVLTFIFRLHGYAWFILYKYNHHLCWNKWFRRCF